MAFSDYSLSNSKFSLPGAEHDVGRLSAAFKAAGFDITSIMDPDRVMVERELSEFRATSSLADVAFVYVTGHGVEVGGVTYLLPGDYPFAQGKDALERHAISLNALGMALGGKKVNAVFFGACRDNPF